MDLLKLLSMSTETEFLEAYATIRVAYKEAMTIVEQAVSHEESEDLKKAIAMYEKALEMIESIFTIPVGLPDDIDNVEAEWKDGCMLIQKLKSAKAEISYRLKILRDKVSTVDTDAEEADENVEPATKRKPVLIENPATHYDINNVNGTPKTYKEISIGLRQLIATKDTDVQFETVFQAQVKLYKIEATGGVITLSRDTAMSLVMCTVGGPWKYLNGIYFIQCAIPDEDLAEITNNSGSTAAAAARNMVWVYPLIPTITNCYRTDFKAFIFPDMEAGVPGDAFGIIITKPIRPLNNAGDEEEQLGDLRQFFLDLLEAVLAGTVPELKSPTRSPRDASQQVSRNIIGAADFIARNLVKGAEKTGDLMIKGTPYLISKMQPAPVDVAPVPSSVQTSVEVAQKVTHAAVGVTGWVAGKVGSASLAIGRYMAPHIQTQGSRLLQKSFGYDSAEANSKMEGALTIAAGAVEGFSTVYNGLETSAKILGNCLSENSVKIIEHKYGASAGNVAAGTFDTVGNAFIVSQNVNYITPKGIAKKMVKNTGEAVVDDYKRALRSDESHFIAAGALYPDLRSLKEKIH